MENNELKIKLSGIANIPTNLFLGDVYDLTISNAEVRELKDTPNDNGSWDRVYKLVISEMSEVNIISAKEIIKAKKRGGQSKLLRYRIQQKWEEEGGEGEFENFYISKMTEIIASLINE